MAAAMGAPRQVTTKDMRCAPKKSVHHTWSNENNRGSCDTAREWRMAEALRSWWGHKNALCNKAVPVELRVQKFFEAMNWQRVVPNVIIYTYNFLISVLEKGQRAERARKLFEAMKQQGIAPQLQVMVMPDIHQLRRLGQRLQEGV